MPASGVLVTSARGSEHHTAEAIEWLAAGRVIPTNPSERCRRRAKVTSIPVPEIRHRDTCGEAVARKPIAFPAGHPCALGVTELERVNL
jgi:selenocysteine lyase/cysteine desulfurase